jgi:hypothetical protein
MRLQDSQANCGSVAVKNALCALGIDRSTEECEILCGTTATQGTTPRRMIKGLESIHELDVAIISETRKEIALLLLQSALRDGRPVIILVDNNEHWISAIGLLGDRIIIADGADYELVTSNNSEGLLTRWCNSSSKRQSYYGIRI